MKKNVKAIFAGLAAAALLAGFSSCSNGSSDDSLNKPAGTSSGANQIDTNNEEVFSGDLITYVISVASTDSENTKLILQYDRSAAGAKEQIFLTDADLTLTVNGAAVDTPKTITFALDSYSSFKDGYNAGTDGEEKDASKHKTYKCTIDLKKQLSVNDKVTLQLNKAKVTGEGASSVKLGSIVATIVDIAPAANYWKELSETKYQTLITKKNGADLNATVAVEEPANPTPANNTPENPAPANPTPENPTPATPENTSTNTNNTSTPAAGTTTETNLLAEALDLNSWAAGTKIEASNFPAEKKKIEIYFTKGTLDEQTFCISIKTGDWQNKYVVTDKISGQAMVANDGNEPEKTIWPYKGDTEQSFTFTPSDEDWTSIHSDGLVFQGYGPKITKVVLK